MNSIYILFFRIDGVVGEGEGLGQEYGRHSACHQGGVKSSVIQWFIQFSILTSYMCTLYSYSPFHKTLPKRTIAVQCTHIAGIDRELNKPPYNLFDPSLMTG